MIAAWMIYAVAVGLLISGAALLTERALQALGRPVRALWAVALGASLLVPCVAHFLPRTLPLPALLANQVSAARDAYRARLPDRGPGTGISAVNGPLLDRALVIGWGLAAVGLCQLMLYSLAVLNGRRREWRRQEVDGVTALIAPAFGPAVVGWRRLEIVLPEWALRLADDARALVVRHEREHVEQRDPRLLLHAFFVVLAMPWNPALWWQFRRLRRAIELDCDARVLRAGADAARYGEVLLEAGGFCRSAGLPALATFAERAADLEARIRALAPAPAGRRAARVTAAVACATVLAAGACLVPDPLSPELSREVATAATRAGSPAPGTIEWIRAQLAGRTPAEVVILYRSSTGGFLGSVGMRRPAGGGRLMPEREAIEVPTADIASVEVLKSPVLGVPGVGGAVVVTLRPGARLRK